MSEFVAARQRERNREVSFPDKDVLYQGQELEQIILADEWLLSTELSDTITSGAIDRYATWLSQLTGVDTLHRERGSFLFLGAETGKWTLPTNPLIGDEKAVTSLVTNKPKSHFPVARFHSHPDSTAFSGQDLARVLVNHGMFFEGENDAYLEVIGAQGVNYLIIRCGDTQFIDEDRVETMIKEYQQLVDSSVSNLAHHIGNLAGKVGLSPAEAWESYQKILVKEEEQFGANYNRYFNTINVVNFLSEQHKFGFYRSAQDGVFKKVTRDDLAAIREKEGEIITNVINEAIDSKKE